MYTFPDLIKKIRSQAGLTQEELARVLDVSTVLISMIETGQKEVSKGFITRLAEKLEVRPGSIIPFVFSEQEKPAKLSGIERTLVDLGEKLQDQLINVRAKKLKQYV